VTRLLDSLREAGAARHITDLTAAFRRPGYSSSTQTAAARITASAAGPTAVPRRPGAGTTSTDRHHDDPGYDGAALGSQPPGPSQNAAAWVPCRERCPAGSTLRSAASGTWRERHPCPPEVSGRRGLRAVPPDAAPRTDRAHRRQATKCPFSQLLQRKRPAAAES
jgi:hypothetical protein